MPSATSPKKTTAGTTAARNRARAAEARAAAAQAVAGGPDEKYAATSWGGDSLGLVDLTTPSGQLCLVRRPGVEGLVTAGVLHDVDALTALVDSTHLNKGAPDSPATNATDASALMKDPDKFASLVHMVDRVTTYVVVKPEVEMTPDDPTRRVTGKVYCDMIDLRDRMFILQYVVGGTSDFEQFREGSADALGGVDAQ